MLVKCSCCRCRWPIVAHVFIRILACPSIRSASVITWPSHLALYHPFLWALTIMAIFILPSVAFVPTYHSLHCMHSRLRSESQSLNSKRKPLVRPSLTRQKLQLQVVCMWTVKDIMKQEMTPTQPSCSALRQEMRKVLKVPS